MQEDHEMIGQIRQIIEGNQFLQRCLDEACAANLPNWWMVGGALRDSVWATLLGRDFTPGIKDVDLIYYNSKKILKKFDKDIEINLRNISNVKWSVKNQARMHYFERVKRYESIEEAISYFPETISCVAFKRTQTGRLIIINLFGLSDLLNIKFRPSPSFLERYSSDEFVSRLIMKGWIKKWPEALICV